MALGSRMPGGERASAVAAACRRAGTGSLECRPCARWRALGDHIELPTCVRGQAAMLVGVVAVAERLVARGAVYYYELSYLLSGPSRVGAFGSARTEVGLRRRQ